MSDTNAELRDHAGPRTNAFISYSRRDIAFVDRLAVGLEAHGITPSIDRSEIYAFEDWWKRIESLIAAADTIVFVLSPDAVASDICRKEVECAQTLNKRFAPIVCRSVAGEMDKVPPVLADLNFVFFDGPDAFETALPKLVEALETDIGWVRLHTEYGLDATEWEKAGHPAGLLLRSPRLEDAERWIVTRPPGAPAPVQAAQAFILASRRGATRRRNALTGSLAAGLVIAIGLAGAAYWQRGVAIEQRAQAIAQRAEAVRQRHVAEHNFTAAKGALRGLIFDVAEGLQNVPGMRAQTIGKILQTVRTTVQGLAVNMPDDVELMRIKAVMLDNFVATFVAAGDTKDALDSARESNSIFRALVARDPGDLQLLRDMSVNLTNLGQAELEAGDRPGALATLVENLAIARRLSERQPGDAQARADVGDGLDRIGDVKLQSGDREGAAAAYQESLDIDRKVAAVVPGDAQAQRNLSVGLVKVGDVKLALGDRAAAFSAYLESLDIRYRLAEQYREDRQAQRDVSVGLERIGIVLQQSGDQAEALHAYQEGLDIDRKLAAQDADNLESQHDLLASLSRLASVEVSLDREKAETLLKEALPIAEKIAGLRKGDGQAANELAATRKQLQRLASP